MIIIMFLIACRTAVASRQPESISDKFDLLDILGGFMVHGSSAIQRAEDFVGIEMPIVPLSSAKACGANVIKVNLNNFIFFFGGSRRAQDDPVNAHGDHRRLNFLYKKKFPFLSAIPARSSFPSSHECDRLFLKSTSLSRIVGQIYPTI
jgi:hypothetical protein